MPLFPVSDVVAFDETYLKYSLSIHLSKTPYESVGSQIVAGVWKFYSHEKCNAKVESQWMAVADFAGNVLF